MITLPQATRKAVRIVGETCFYCDGPNEHADHVLATANGGDDRAENLVASCAKCNCSKNDSRLPSDVHREALIHAFISAPKVERIAQMLLARANTPSFARTKEFGFIFGGSIT